MSSLDPAFEAAHDALFAVFGEPAQVRRKRSRTMPVRVVVTYNVQALGDYSQGVSRVTTVKLRNAQWSPRAGDMLQLPGARLRIDRIVLRPDSLSRAGMASLREVADVMLPIAPFTETSGTFVNCEGRAQSFNAVAKQLGDTRPGWKVLRVLGNLLQFDGFDQGDSEVVRIEALGKDVPAVLSNAVEGVELTVVERPSRLQRVADVPIYFADALVRRAPSLQRTRDAAAPVARIASVSLASLGLNSGDKVAVTGSGKAELTVMADDTVAAGCVRIAAAHVSTVALGPMCGELSVERV